MVKVFLYRFIAVTGTETSFLLKMFLLFKISHVPHNNHHNNLTRFFYPIIFFISCRYFIVIKNIMKRKKNSKNSLIFYFFQILVFLFFPCSFYPKTFCLALYAIFFLPYILCFYVYFYSCYNLLVK